MAVVKEVGIFRKWLVETLGARGEQLAKLLPRRQGMARAMILLNDQELADWMWWRAIYQELLLDEDDTWEDDAVLAQVRWYQDFTAGYLVTGGPRFPLFYAGVLKAAIEEHVAQHAVAAHVPDHW